MGLQVYDTIYAFLDGIFLQELTDSDLSWEGDNVRVMTLAKGFGGVSPGPKVLVVALSHMMPATGSEFDAPSAFVHVTIHELKPIKGATGQTIISPGFTDAPKANAGVGKASTESYTFVGQPHVWA